MSGQFLFVAMYTCNSAQYLQEQLDGIAVQTCLPSEVVVCNDGSKILVKGWTSSQGDNNNGK